MTYSLILPLAIATDLLKVVQLISGKEFMIKDTIKALQDASMAQDTADGKRRVLLPPPYPPYDIGDLWRVTNVVRCGL